MSFFRAVTGKGKIAVKPDKIRLYVNKEELCKEYEDTLRRSTEDTELLKDLFEKLGFQRKDLKTVYYNSGFHPIVTGILYLIQSGKATTNFSICP